MSEEMRKELNFLRHTHIKAKEARVEWIAKLTADLSKNLLEWVRDEKPILKINKQ